MEVFILLTVGEVKKVIMVISVTFDLFDLFDQYDHFNFSPPNHQAFTSSYQTNYLSAGQ